MYFLNSADGRNQEFSFIPSSHLLIYQLPVTAKLPHPFHLPINQNQNSNLKKKYIGFRQIDSF
jgi:hypothetical protein